MRFETEKEIYLQTHDSMYQELNQKKRKKKKKKDPNAPKKNRSSYILFVADHRQQAIAELPEGARQVEIMSRVGLYCNLCNTLLILVLRWQRCGGRLMSTSN